jgi:hypothetical protein
VDVSVDDVPKAIAFYQALFGWDIQVGGPEVGGYSIAHLDNRIVAAVSPKYGPAEAPPAWTRPPTRSRARGVSCSPGRWTS